MTLLLGEATLAVASVQATAVGGAWQLRRQERLLQRFLPYLVSLAVGVLLATAIFDLLPESVAQLGNRPATWTLLGATMLALFAIERIFSALTGTATEPEVHELGQTQTHHHHDHDHCAHTAQTTRPLNLVLAAMLHSFVDGTAVAVAFAASARIGWLTAFAIALHEVPHRMGDFAVLIHLGLRARKALQLAILAGVPSFLGLAVVMLLGAAHGAATSYLLPISAGSFLYIATVNLLPEIQWECRIAKVLLQLLWMLGGAVLVAVIAQLPYA